MDTKDNMQDAPYVFWLFNWGYQWVLSTLRLVPQYQRCEISKDSISISDKDLTIIIRFDEIQSYSLESIYEGRGSGHTKNLKILCNCEVLQNGTKQKKLQTQIFIAPADVFDHYMDEWELKNMYEVINCHKSGAESTIERNPYHRMLLRRGKKDRIAEQNWDPTLPPSYYGSLPTAVSIVKRIVLTFIGVMAGGVVVVAIIYYIATTFF